MSAKNAINAIVEDGKLFKEFIHGGPEDTVLTEGGRIPTLAKFASDTADLLAQGLTSWSMSMQTVGLGTKTLPIQSGKQFTNGQWLVLGNAEATMVGTVTSYDDDMLVIDVKGFTGEGDHAEWSIGLSGPPGPAGPPGQDGENTNTGNSDRPLITTFPWEE